MSDDNDSSNTTSEEECPLSSSGIPGRIGCILTYGGSTSDIWINYLLLAANFFWCLQVVLRKRALQREQPGVTWCRILSLTGVALFQVVLCLLLGCSGISIIWCAMAGWALRQEWLLYPQELSQDLSDGQQTLESSRRNQWGWILDVNDKIWPNAAALVYYGVVAPPITTVAHVCALLLGYLLAYKESHWFGGDNPVAAWDDLVRVPQASGTNGLNGNGTSYQPV